MLKLLIALICSCFVSANYEKTTPQSCETSPDGLYLCPIRIGLGISKIKAIGARPVQEGSRVAWNNEGWCGLAHDVLEIDFGRIYDIKMIKVKKVLSSPSPEYVRLDYFDAERGQGEYQRLIGPQGMDNFKAVESGTTLPDMNGAPISTDRVKVFMVLPETMNSAQRACMKLEIYYHESKGQKISNVNFFQAPGVELNFGRFKLRDDDSAVWWQFPFALRNKERVSSAEITWRISPMSSADLDSLERDVRVRLFIRANADSSQAIEKDYAINHLHVDTLRFNSEVTTNLLDVMFTLSNREVFGRNGQHEAFYRILFQKIVFRTSLDEEITYRFDGQMKKEAESRVWLKYSRISPAKYDNKKREAILIEPRDRSREYMTLAMRCNINWAQTQVTRSNLPRTFTSQYATGYDIFASMFTKTLEWRQLKTSREDTFWVTSVKVPVKSKLVFYFDEKHDQIEISNIIAYEDKWDGSEPNFTITSATPASTGTTLAPAVCTNFFCNNTTVAGIIVGIICALMVIAFIAIFLVWKRRPSDYLGQTTNYTMGSNRGGHSGGGPIYGTRPNQTPLLESDRLNGIYSLPDNIPKPPQRGRTMPNFPDNFNQHNSPPSPSSRDHRRGQRPKPNTPRQPKTMAPSTSRPPVAPPPAPEPIYEPPINFRENSPRLYGPCGTIRYAQPDALKSKADPPRIQAELVRILEPLGSGEFGDVLLVEAPISAFPADSINLDLPKGAKDCLAALKRLKTNSSTETKETFLAEAKLMYGLRHPNILPLLAVIPEVPALLTGYSEHGDLRQFLRRRLTCESTNLDDPGFISNSSLLDITVQIASAMAYLESVRVVHRDLAARNCFVGRGLQVRVGDFGMSRNLYSSDYFKVTGNAVLPIRWSAWESIILGKFTTKSDVWSFAVTCCETFTLCRERPLETMTDEQVIHRMVSLYKEQSSLTKIPWLPKPDICPEGVWEIIMNCWIRDAESRPSFKQLHQLLLEEKRQIENQTVSNSIQI